MKGSNLMKTFAIFTVSALFLFCCPEKKCGLVISKAPNITLPPANTIVVPDTGSVVWSSTVPDTIYLITTVPETISLVCTVPDTI